LETTKNFLLTREDTEENDTSHQAFGVAEEIKDLSAKSFDVELSHGVFSRMIRNGRISPETKGLQGLSTLKQIRILKNDIWTLGG
jgi:hypothetical protein